MDGKTTIRYLQNWIRQKDYHPELQKDYFLKLAEEVGELSCAMRKGAKAPDTEHIQGTIDEEIWDVIYYAIAIANLYDVDLEAVIRRKAEINEIRYPSLVRFEENR
ncbi:MAG: hypothetical protein IJZ74_02560 [Clostridia bacterium]|nr:hypothetical protein [Clostridia bacterium]